MKIPDTVKNLIKAQEKSDATTYAACFSETATVLDEGHTYQGRSAIENWIDNANKQFKTVMKPVDYVDTENILQAEVSGDFPGSPVVLSYHFTFENNLIRSLKITV